MESGDIRRPAPVETKTPRNSFAWRLPDVVQARTPDGQIRRGDPLTISQQPVTSPDGKFLGRIFEIPFAVEPGDGVISADFVLHAKSGGMDVITGGGNSWSQSTKTKSPIIMPKDHGVGSAAYKDSLGREHAPFFETGPKKQKVPKDQGRSYGTVNFQNDGTNYFLGMVPGLDTLERITYREVDGKIVVSVEKDFEGIGAPESSQIRVFVGEGNPREGGGKYADFLAAYEDELTALTGEVPRMRDRVIGFSWPAYGKQINEEIISQELKDSKGLVDTYIIDDGGSRVDDGLAIDEAKFPNGLTSLKEQADALGIKLGWWLSPFVLKGAEVDRLTKEGHGDWVMQDEVGKPVRIPIDLPSEEKSPLPAKPRYGLDISHPEAREHVISRIVALADQGIDVFKLDFLNAAFTGPLQNKDKTSVEYYRETIKGAREAVRNRFGREIELIGCGAPMLESIGLFNGMRMTSDSALPDPATVIPGYGKTFSFLSSVTGMEARMNNQLYADAAAVASRRALSFGNAHGLILDGIHLSDPDVPYKENIPHPRVVVDGDLYKNELTKRDRLNNAFITIGRNLGISNFFIGDSFAHMTERDRQGWEIYVAQFKDIDPLPQQAI